LLQQYLPMKKNLVLLACLVSLLSHSQYYYQDVVGVADLQRRMSSYVSAGVKSATATGYDARGAKTTDFNEWQEVLNDGRMLKITSRNGQAVSRQYYSFDDAGRLKSLRDSSKDIETRTDYEYGSSNRLEKVKITVTDSMQEFNKNEERFYHYNNAGKLLKMVRVVNGVDTSAYDFLLDESGNVSEEKLYRITNSADPVYYYYDDANRLTDIVRYNKRLKRLLPDVMFEYDDEGRVIQRITIVSTIQPDYLTWRYIFDEKGLKTKEAMFNKDKVLQGRIEYNYRFE